MSPDRWVTLCDVYRCTLDPERIESKIAVVEVLVEPPAEIRVRTADLAPRGDELPAWSWSPAGDGTFRTEDDAASREQFTGLGIPFEIDRPAAATRRAGNDSTPCGLTRQSQLIPIVATQSISSLREVMINEPGTVFVERAGRMTALEAPALTVETVAQALIQIARSLGEDPATDPIIDALLADGSRVAVCSPPAAPRTAITIRRFGGRAFTIAELSGSGSLPAPVVEAAVAVLRGERNVRFGR